MKIVSTFWKKLTQHVKTVACFAFLNLPALAFASTTQPWDTPLQTILNSLTGTTATIIIGIAMALAGLTVAFADLQGGMAKLVKVAFGGTIAIFAVQIASIVCSTHAAVIAGGHAHAAVIAHVHAHAAVSR